jgi:molybdopterin-guanine dinucleotide biosynthesis protein A
MTENESKSLDTDQLIGDLSMRSAIVLAGGGSTRMSSDKGLRKLGSEPLTTHVVSRLSDLVDEVLLVVGSEAQRALYSGVVGEEAKILVDLYGDGSPLVGALTGFMRARGGYALVTGCDMPFISREAVRLLFDEAEGIDGAVFQWPNGWVEPLLAVYRVEPSRKVAEELYRAGNLRLRMILLELPKVKMIPIEALERIDPELLTLHDVDDENSLREAEKILRKQNVELISSRDRDFES